MNKLKNLLTKLFTCLLFVFSLSGCNFTFNVKVQKIEFNILPSQINKIIDVGQNIEIVNERVFPENATNKDVVYTIEDPTIAKIENKVITGLTPGTTKIIARAQDGSNVSASKTFTVVQQPTQIELLFSNNQIEIGEEAIASISVVPSNAKKAFTLSTTSNKVTINDNKITGVSTGLAWIKATTPNGLTSEKSIEVVNVTPKQINVVASKTSLTVGETATISTTVLPEEAVNKSVTYSTNSGNQNVISVNSSGVVTAIHSGIDSVVITSNANSNVKKEISFTVSAPVPTSISITCDNEIAIGQEIHLNPTVLPALAEDKEVVYSLKNGLTNVLTVSSTGVVKGISAGSETVVCKLKNYPTVKTEIGFTVVHVPTTKITLSAPKTELKLGEETQISTTFTPSNASQRDLCYEVYRESTNRGSRFIAGSNVDYTFERFVTIEEEITIDIKFDSGTDADKYISFMLGQGWESYTGYYKLLADGRLGGNYTGVSLSKKSDGYFRMTFDLSKVSKVEDKPLPSTHISMLYVRGNWTTASGYIDVNSSLKDSIRVSGTGKVTSINLGEEYVRVYVKDNPSIYALIKFKVVSNPDNPSGDDIFD